MGPQFSAHVLEINALLLGRFGWLDVPITGEDRASSLRADLSIPFLEGERELVPSVSICGHLVTIHAVSGDPEGHRTGVLVGCGPEEHP